MFRTRRDTHEMVRIPQTLKGGAAYIFASIVQRAAIFVLLPFLTRAMSAAEFGRVGVALSLTQLLNFVFTLGLETAVIRNWYASKNDDAARGRVLQAASFLLLAAVPALGLAVLGGLWLSGWPYLDSGVWVVLVASSSCFAALTALPLAAMRAQQRLGNYLLVTAVQAVCAVVGTGVFVLVLHGGVLGWISGAAIGNLAGLLVAALLLPWPRPRASAVAARVALLAAGLPMVPHLASQWGLQLSDRVVGVSVLDDQQLGGLTLAFNLVIPLLVVGTGVSQGLQPLFALAGSEPEQTPRLRRGLVAQVHILGFLAAAIAGFGPVAVELLFKPELGSAAHILPILAGGTALWALYSLPMNTLSLLIGRTTRVWMLTGLILVAKLTAILVLVPRGAVADLTWVFLAANAALLAGTSALAMRHEGGRAALAGWTLVMPAVVGAVAVGAAGVLALTSAPLAARAAGVSMGLCFYAAYVWRSLRGARVQSRPPSVGAAA